MEQNFYGHLATLLPERSEARSEAFDKMRHASFPYVERTGKQAVARVQDILETAFFKGPIRIER